MAGPRRESAQGSSSPWGTAGRPLHTPANSKPRSRACDTVPWRGYGALLLKNHPSWNGMAAQRLCHPLMIRCTGKITQLKHTFAPNPPALEFERLAVRNCVP